jgi:hypothetical protein
MQNDVFYRPKFHVKWEVISKLVLRTADLKIFRSSVDEGNLLIFHNHVQRKIAVGV